MTKLDQIYAQNSRRKILFTELRDVSGNYGNSLQHYALKEILNQKGFDVDSLVYPLEARGKVNDAAKNGQINAIRKIQTQNDPTRIKIFDSFYNEFINGTVQVSPDEISLTDTSQYDYVITGSDQVWNRRLMDSDETLKFFYLSFAKYEQRVNYAPSFGVKKLYPSEYAIHKEGLEGFRFLSSRETFGCDLIKRLTGRHAELVLDPTLLLNPEQWRKISRKPAYELPEHYALYYTFGVFPDEVSSVIRDLTDGIDLINIRDVKRPEYFCTGPCEFVYLIDHADYIFTNSFHGTAFSLNFDKKFFPVVGTNHEWFNTHGSRIESLLSTTGINDNMLRDVNGGVISLPVNYDYVHDRLNAMRESSMKYLRECLNLKV